MQRLVIAVLVALLVGGGAGYYLGASVESGRAAHRELDTAIEYANAWQSDLETARADAEAESLRRTAQALRNASAEARARETKLKGQQDAIANARPGCDWPDGRVGMLNAAVDAANGVAAGETGAIGVPEELPDSAEAAGRR